MRQTTLRKLIIRTIDQYMDFDEMYEKAKQEVMYEESQVISSLNPEQTEKFLAYESARENLEAERMRRWCKMLLYYYDRRGENDDNK